jgi:hypothetical protein
MPDPDIWKQLANLTDDWKTIVVGGVAILTAIWTVLKWGMKAVVWAFLLPIYIVRLIWLLATRGTLEPDSPFSPPKLQFEFDEEESGWHRCSIEKKQGMCVFGEWLVTNSSDKSVWIDSVRLGQYKPLLSEASTGNFKGHCIIGAQEMTRIKAEFTFVPAIFKDGKSLIDDVIFTSEFYEKSYRVRSCRFSYIGP